MLAGSPGAGAGSGEIQEPGTRGGSGMLPLPGPRHAPRCGFGHSISWRCEVLVGQGDGFQTKRT